MQQHQEFRTTTTTTTANKTSMCALLLACGFTFIVVGGDTLHYAHHTSQDGVEPLGNVARTSAATTSNYSASTNNNNNSSPTHMLQMTERTELTTLASELARQVTAAFMQQQQQQQAASNNNATAAAAANNAAANSCAGGLLTFELSTGFIYRPSAAETLAMMPSTLQLTDCLDYCLHNATCLAINFEMGLCVLLSSSAQQNPLNLFISQFPIFTIYAEKKCLLRSGKSAVCVCV